MGWWDDLKSKADSIKDDVWSNIDPLVPNEAIKSGIESAWGSVESAWDHSGGFVYGEIGEFFNTVELNPPGDITKTVLDKTGISDMVKWAIFASVALAVLYFMMKGKAA